MPSLIRFSDKIIAVQHLRTYFGLYQGFTKLYLFKIVPGIGMKINVFDKMLRLKSNHAETLYHLFNIGEKSKSTRNLNEIINIFCC